MCGRFEGQNETWQQLHELLSGFAHLPAETAAQYADREIRPTNRYPVIRPAVGSGYEIIEARWGLIPYFWNKPIKEWKATTINATIEDVETKPSYKSAWKSKHCLVPVRSFWEWQTQNPEAPKAKQVKTRYCITRADNHPMVFAGLYDRAKTADGEVVSFTIMTRPNGPDMAGLHTREPIMLDPDQWAPWLACDPMPELSLPTRELLFRPVAEQREAYA